MISQVLLIVAVELSSRGYSGKLVADPSDHHSASLSVVSRLAADPNFHHRPPNLDRVFKFFESENHYRTNSHGIRGTELPTDPAVKKVLCIGGSTTELTYLDHSETWFQVAMDRLNETSDSQEYWFGGVGMTGFDSAHHLAYVRRSAFFGRADYAVFMIGINDMLGPLLSQTLVKQPLWLRTNIAWLVTKDLVLKLGLNPMAREDTEGVNLGLRVERRKRAPKLVKAPPFELDIAVYVERVQMIAEFSKKRNVIPIFMTQPTLWSNAPIDPFEHIYWTGATQTGAYLSTLQLRERMDMFNQALLDTCREIDVACIDLSSITGQPGIFFDDCHFSATGSSAIAQFLIEWFNEHAPTR